MILFLSDSAKDYTLLIQNNYASDVQSTISAFYVLKYMKQILYQRYQNIIIY